MKKEGTRRCLHQDTKSLITPSLHLCTDALVQIHLSRARVRRAAQAEGAINPPRSVDVVISTLTLFIFMLVVYVLTLWVP